MKRCIICGNVDDDSSTVCSTCGNPYIDMSGRVSDADAQVPEAEASQEAAGQENPDVPQGTAGQQEEAGGTVQELPAAEGSQSSEAPQDLAQELFDADASRGSVQELSEVKASRESVQELSEVEALRESVQESSGEETPQGAVSGQPQAGRVPENRLAQSSSRGAGAPRSGASGRPPRRTHGSPQIYGQTEGMSGAPQQYADQGMIRRDVPPRTAGAGRPAGQTPEGDGRSAGQGARGAGRPMGQMPGGAGRPMGQMSGAGRPAGQDFLSRRVIGIARKAMRSPLFFLIALLNTASVVASIAAIFLKELNYSQVVRLLNETELPRQAAGYVSSATTLLQKLDSGMIAANIALHIPSILFCLGLWLIFFTALTAKDRMSGVGFGFAKAAVIIRMIVACIVMLAVLIVTVTVVVAAWVSKEQPVIIMAVVMLVITIIVVMMIIMYYFSYLGTLKTCRINGNTGESYGKPSAYLAVLLIVLALPGIVGLLSGIVNMEISNIVGSVAEMGWMILFAVWIFLYRGKMGELED